MLIAQTSLAGWGLVQWLIAIIVICGMIGIAYVVTRAMGVAIPGWLIQVFWILLAVVVGVLAIRFLASMF